MATNAANRVVQYLRQAALRQNGVGLTDGELMERYVARQDEAAFEALIRRHGPMVLAVCWRILRNRSEAEDAFQATFLVFIQKASSIRSRATVSNWLYGVAHNIALRAKTMAQRRHVKEREAAMAPRDEGHTEVWQELQILLHAELSGLPEKYRAPIVLCDLEGKTIKLAAHMLGWPQGTVATRLTRGRAHLAQRLTKHGLTLSGGVIAAALAQEPALANLPSTLVASTVKAISLYTVAGQNLAAGVISAKVGVLADGVMKTMLLSKLQGGVAFALVLAFSGAGAVVYRAYAADSSQPALTSSPEAQRPSPAVHARQAIEPGPVDARHVAALIRDDKSKDTPVDNRELQKEWKLARFDEVFVTGPIKVFITPGSEQHITVRGKSELVRRLEPRVVKKEKNNRLVLDLNDQGDKAELGADSIEVRIVVPRLSSVIAEGMAVVDVQRIANDSISLTVSDTAKIDAAGSSKKLSAFVKDDGQLDASRLAADDVTVVAAGKSFSTFRPAHSFNVMSSGDSRLEYTGTPAQLHKITSDRSTIIRR